MNWSTPDKLATTWTHAGQQELGGTAAIIDLLLSDLGLSGEGWAPGHSPCLLCRYKLTIVGPKADEERIPGIDVALADGESWSFGGLTMHVMDTPGHTQGHITLWFPEADALFPGEEPRPSGKPDAGQALQQGWWLEG